MYNIHEQRAGRVTGCLDPWLKLSEPLDSPQDGGINISMASTLKVLYLAAEAVPFVKASELADIAGILPQAISATEGVDIRLVLPFYNTIRQQSFDLSPAGKFSVSQDGSYVQAEALVTRINGLTVYLLSSPGITPGDPVYTSDAAADADKFVFFSQAALDMLEVVDFSPDILHANDWHTAAAVYGLSLRRESQPRFRETASLIGLHNLPHLGVEASRAMQRHHLPRAHHSLLPWWAQDMLLPLGLLTADHIVAASPTYAQDIMKPDFGAGLHEFLQSRAGSISGILHGIDPEQWNPAKDDSLAATFNRATLSRRVENKLALQRELGLAVDPRIPVFGMVSRLTPQKEIDLLPQVFRAIDYLPWQAILLGTGMPKLENDLRQLEDEYPQRVHTALRYDERLSRRIYAGADAILIPSRYEPCGLTQMVAMRYGCVPVAQAAGGLQSTIIDSQASPMGTGFLYPNHTLDDMLTAIHAMLEAYQQPRSWQAIQRRGMQIDFTWRRSAQQYLELYKTLATHSRVARLI